VKHIAIAASMLLLAACQSPSTTTDSASDDLCQAQSRQHLVGTPASELDKSTLPQGTRVLYPDSVATMDYRRDRLNVMVDKAGKIESVSCG